MSSPRIPGSGSLSHRSGRAPWFTSLPHARCHSTGAAGSRGCHRLRPRPCAVTSPTRPAPTWYGPQPQRSGVQRAQLAVTLLIVGLPLAGVVVVAASFLGGSATLVNLSLLTIGYVITGLGITAGFHRLFTHRSFTANRGLRISLAVAGSLAFEGGVISWVATHRRHHAFSDRSGDPHSPHRYGGGLWGQCAASAMPTWGGCSARHDVSLPVRA